MSALDNALAELAHTSPTDTTEAEKELRQLRLYKKDNAKLRKLRKYADHYANCPYRLNTAHMKVRHECTCGLNDLK